MINRSVARRYAKAFIGLASSPEQVAELAADLHKVLDACLLNDSELYHTLCNPGFTLAERTAVVDALIGALGVQPLTGNLLRLLLDKHRFSYFPDVVEAFHQDADQAAGRIRVQLATVQPLDADTMGQIKTSLAALTGKHILLETVIDPSLIGGLVARVGDTIYDGSLRAQLTNLRVRITQTPI